MLLIKITLCFPFNKCHMCDWDSRMRSSATTRAVPNDMSSLQVWSWCRPSAAHHTIFCCQANKWLVSAAVSVYWLLILSLSWGWRLALHLPPPCSLTGKVLTLLISFFTALCQNIHLQTLKTSAIARHLQPHKVPFLMPDSFPLFLYMCICI